MSGGRGIREGTPAQRPLTPSVLINSRRAANVPKPYTRIHWLVIGEGIIVMWCGPCAYLVVRFAKAALHLQSLSQHVERCTTGRAEQSRKATRHQRDSGMLEYEVVVQALVACGVHVQEGLELLVEHERDRCRWRDVPAMHQRWVTPCHGEIWGESMPHISRGGSPLKSPHTPSSLTMVTSACRGPSYLHTHTPQYLPPDEQPTSRRKGP